MSSMAPIRLTADPVLPQRDLLLNVEEVGQRLSAQLGADGPLHIRDCERLRVKYRVGRSLRVLYRMDVDSGSHMIAARAFPPGESGHVYEREAQTSLSCGTLRPVLRDAELDTIFWTFPHDRKIANLQVFANVPPGMLSRVLDDRWTHSRLIAYAPEKCATAQCLNDRRELLAYAKVYGGQDGERCYGIYSKLWRGLSAERTPLRIPQAIHYSAAHRTLLLEAIQGKRIADLGGEELRSGFRYLGAALASLHALPLADGLPRYQRLDMGRLQQAARIIGMACSEVAGLAQELSHQLNRGWQPSNHEVCLHGDVHLKNGILVGDGVALVDLDQVAAGPPAADVGSLLAALRYARCIGHFSEATEYELASAFFDGYCQICQLPDAASLRWHAAAALLAERALRAINRIRPEGLQHLGDLLASAQEALTGRDYD